MPNKKVAGLEYNIAQHASCKKLRVVTCVDNDGEKVGILYTVGGEWCARASDEKELYPKHYYDDALNALINYYSLNKNDN